MKRILKEKGVKLLRKTDAYVLDGRVIEMLGHEEVRVDGRIVRDREIEGIISFDDIVADC